MMTIPETPDLVAWSVAGVLVLAVLVKVYPWVRKVVEVIDALDGLPPLVTQMRRAVTSTEGLADAVEEIRHEVKTNDGSSLKDSTRRLEDAADEMSKDIGGIREEQRIQRQEQADQSAQINATAQQLASHLGVPAADPVTPAE